MLTPLTFNDLQSEPFLSLQKQFEELWRDLTRQKAKLDAFLISKNPLNQRRRDMLALTALGTPFDLVEPIIGIRAAYMRNKSWAILRRITKWPIDRAYVNSSYAMLDGNRLWAPRFWEYPWAIVNTRPKPGMKVLDIGSSRSLFPILLAKMGANITATDIEPADVLKISPFIARLLSANVHYKFGDVTQLAFPDNDFDFVYCISVLEHLEEELQNGSPVNFHRRNLDLTAIRELMRVLKPGGRLAITVDWSEDPRNLRSYRLNDIIKRLVRPFRKDLLNDKEPIVQWDSYSPNLARLWQEYYPCHSKEPSLSPYASSAFGIMMQKKLA